MRKWLNALERLFTAPPVTEQRPRLDIAKFALGVCPGCRGLRGVASLRCSHCGSAKPVTEDA
ncbi:MAG: hypothetical protein ACXWLB_10815 [Reyranella sp.]